MWKVCLPARSCGDISRWTREHLRRLAPLLPSQELTLSLTSILLFVLVLATICLAVAGKRTPSLRTPTLAVAGLATVVTVIRLWTTFAAEEGASVDVPPEEALGYVLASRVQADCPEGGKLIVFGPNTDEERLLAVTNARMDGIERALRGPFDIVRRGPQLRYGNTEDSKAWSQMTFGFPLRSFQEWAAEDQDAVAAISLLGMPVGSIPAKGTGLPPLYVVGLSGADWDPNQLPPGVATVVTYRDDRDFDAQRPKTLQAIFDQTFVAYPPRPGDTTGDSALE
jgi:hypothetical protein